MSGDNVVAIGPRFTSVVGLLLMAGITATEEHLGGGIMGIVVRYPTTDFHALVTESEEGPGYALGVYWGDPDRLGAAGSAAPLEFHGQMRLSQVITRLRGLNH